MAYMGLPEKANVYRLTADINTTKYNTKRLYNNEFGRPDKEREILTSGDFIYYKYTIYICILRGEGCVS